MKIILKNCLCCFVGCWLATVATATPTAWQTVAPGLEYTRLGGFTEFPDGYIQAFRIDLNHYNFAIGITKRANDLNFNLADLMHAQKAVLATNGGFFTPELKPLGLRVSQGQQLSPLRSTTWWSVFFIAANRAQIVNWKNYQENPAVNFAIQAGPRLLINRAIPQLKPDIDFRTALGINQAGQIILLATENLLLATGDLAQIMRRSTAEGGLDCVDAINLDGGNSTQMYAQMPNFNLEVPSYTTVADGVLVIPKDT